jgi:hypothetical protein
MIIYGSAAIKVSMDKIWNQPVILGVEHGVVFNNEKLSEK